MKKRFGSYLMLATTAVALLAGCAGGGSKTDTASSGKTTEVVFWHSMGGVQQTALDGIVKKFNDSVGKEKNIEIKAVYQGKNLDLSKKLKAAVQAKDMEGLPNLTTMSSGETAYMKDLDLAIKADKILKDGSIGLTKDDYQPAMMNALSYDGSPVGLPFSSSAILLYYNKDAFAAAGLDPEKAPATVKELSEYSAKLTKKDGDNISQYGFGYAADSWVMASWIGQQKSEGKDFSLFGDKNNGRDGVMSKVVFDSNGTMKHFLDIYKDAAKVGNFKYKEDDPVNNLAAGNITMTLASSASMTTILESVGDKFKLGVATLPKVDENATGSVSFGGSAIYPLNKGSESDLAATYEFIKFLYTEENQLAWHKGTGYLPVIRSVYDSEAYANFIKENPYFAVPSKAVAASNPNVQEALTGVAGTIFNIVKDGIMNALDGNMTVDEAVKYMSDESNKAIEDYNDANY